MIHLLSSFGSLFRMYWMWIALISGAVGVSAMCVMALETDVSRSKRTRRKRERQLRDLTIKISAYAREMNRRFPTGDVVVSEHDLAKQLGQRTEAVITALTLLLNESKAQRVSLKGYWKLNV
jgi:hypothetical protein